MSWIVFAFGFVVIALAVAVALGRFGEMQAKPVLDAARGRIPDGPVDAQFLSALMLPTRGRWYIGSSIIKGRTSRPPAVKRLSTR